MLERIGDHIRFHPRLLELAGHYHFAPKQLGVVRPVDLETRGILRQRLYELLRAGEVERQGRGFYVAKGHSYTAEHALAQVAKRVPGGVICLLTALRFHDLTTQNPADLWIALPEKARKPRLDYPRLRVTRFSGSAFTEGIETHRIEGVEVRVYSAAKTIADCFKYRNKAGIDVAVEALRGFSRRHRGGGDKTRALRPRLPCDAGDAALPGRDRMKEPKSSARRPT